MDFDLFSCTEEELSGLKFNELQKLSTQYRVHKRWAKKRELIEKLLHVRDEEIKKKDAASNGAEEQVKPQEAWTDGAKVFSSSSSSEAAAAAAAVPHAETDDRRLTYCLASADPVADRRLTFNVDKSEVGAKDANVPENFDRRLTYNADDIKRFDFLTSPVNLGKVLENDGEESQKSERNVDAVGKNIDGAGDESDVNKSYVKESSVALNQTDECIKVLSSEVKKLEMPSRCQTLKLSRGGVAKDKRKIDFPKLKLSEKSIKIKKSTGGGVADGHASPKMRRLSQRIRPKAEEKSATPKSTCLGLGTGGGGGGGGLARTAAEREGSCGRGQKETTRAVVPRRKSKTEDNVLVQNLKRTRDIKYFSPGELSTKGNAKRYSDSSRDLNLDLSARSKIPKPKTTTATLKTITATKMPDFSKIHQKRFEHMDSLIDYKRKKEERAKKLFGIPQPGLPLKVNKASSNSIFQFKSSIQKENKGSDKEVAADKDDGDDARTSKKDGIHRGGAGGGGGAKPNIMMTLKEQNRKHINGVRTNKRFELQMKYRKMLIE